MFFSPSPGTNNVRSIYLSDNKKRTRHKTSALNYRGILSIWAIPVHLHIFAPKHSAAKTLDFVK